MNEHWYCYINDRTLGPFTDEDLTSMVRQGQLRSDHMVCRGLKGEWVPAGSLVGLFDSPSPRPKAAGEESGKPSSKAKLRVAKPLAPQSPAPRGADAAPPIRQSAGDSGLTSNAPVAAAAAPRSPQPQPQQAASPQPAAAQPLAPHPLAPHPHAPHPVAPQPFGAPAAQQTAVVRMANANATPASSTHVQHLRDRRKQRTSSMVVTAVTATVAATLLGVIALISMSMSNRKQQEQTADTVAGTTKTKRSKEKAKGKRANRAMVAVNVNRAVEALSKLTREEVVEGVTKWRDTTYSPTVGQLQMTVSDVWMENSKLHVNVQITNQSRRDSRPFTSWNHLRARSESAGALLVNGSGDILTSIAPTNANAELTDKSISPGETVTDTVVFPSPVDMDELKLVLPYAAFGRTGMYGFVIPGDKVAHTPPAAAKLVDEQPADAVEKSPPVADRALTQPPGNAEQPKDAASKAIGSTVGKMPDRGLFSKKSGDENGGDPRTPKTFDGLERAINRARVEK